MTIKLKAQWLAIAGMFACGMAGATEPLPAPTDGRHVHIIPIVSMGLTGGGDTIATYQVEYLGEIDDTPVKLGGNFFIFGGARIFWPASRIGVLLQGGAFVGGIGGYEESVDLTRWPIEALGFYEAGPLSLGVGVTHHLSPTFEEKGLLNRRIDFEDATGIVVQAEYAFDRWGMGVRYSAIDYQFRDITFNADNWGVYGSYRFR